MTEKQRHALLAYFRRIVDALGAPHFELSVEMQPAGGDDHAATWLANEQDRAELHVPANFFSQEAIEQRRVVVHEALHCVLDRGPRAWEDAIEDITPVGFDTALKRTGRRLHERAVETLARQISGFLPLPELPR